MWYFMGRPKCAHYTLPKLFFTNLQTSSQIWRPMKAFHPRHNTYHAWCSTLLGLPYYAYMLQTFKNFHKSARLFRENKYNPIRRPIASTKSTTLGVVLFWAVRTVHLCCQSPKCSNICKLFRKYINTESVPSPNTKSTTLGVVLYWAVQHVHIGCWNGIDFTHLETVSQIYLGPWGVPPQTQKVPSLVWYFSGHSKMCIWYVAQIDIFTNL
jgi:hypothetical protein